MDDQILIHILETACSEEKLIFQVVEQDRYLHIFINREPEQVLNYKSVGRKIYQALTRLSLTDIEGVCLYSRVLGQEEPDWEAKFRLPQQQAAAQDESAEPAQPAQSESQRQMSEAATYIMQDASAQRAEAQQEMAVGGGGDQAVATRSATEVATPAAKAEDYPLSDKDGVTEAAAAYEAAEAAAPTVTVMSEPRSKAVGSAAAPADVDGDFDLAAHCFIRNRMLLTADILPPSKAVAKKINGFHEFSMAEKQRMMPQVELFFKGAPTFSAAGLTEEQQAWFEEMKSLTGDDARKGPIWLSRYCVDAEATLAVVARVFDPSLGVVKPDEAVAEEAAGSEVELQGGAAHSISGSMTEGMTGGTSALPRSPQARPGGSSRRASEHAPAPSARMAAEPEPTPASQWLWPGIVVIGSVVLMCLGMMLAKPAALATSEACRASDASEQCQLASQIVGVEFFDGIKDEGYLAPLSTVKATRDAQLKNAIAYCNFSGAVNAGHSDSNPDLQKTPALNSNAREVSPGIVLADVEHNNLAGPGTVRTACVLGNESWGSQPTDSDLYMMSDAVIPVSWPAEAYENTEGLEVERRVEQAFHPLFTFGSTMLFTTVGLFAAALLRLSVTAYNLTALSQAAIVMSIFEAIFDLLLPLGGIILFPVIIARKSLALGLTGAVVPNFKVDWSGGYMSVASCVAVMTLVRFVLRWLMILTILGGAVA